MNVSRPNLRMAMETREARVYSSNATGLMRLHSLDPTDKCLVLMSLRHGISLDDSFSMFKMRGSLRESVPDTGAWIAKLLSSALT